MQHLQEAFALLKNYTLGNTLPRICDHIFRTQLAKIAKTPWLSMGPPAIKEMEVFLLIGPKIGDRKFGRECFLTSRFGSNYIYVKPNHEL